MSAALADDLMNQLEFELKLLDKRGKCRVRLITIIRSDWLELLARVL